VTTPGRAVARSRTDSTRFAQGLFDGLPGRYDRLGLLLSFGQDRRWRRAMVDAVAGMRPAPQVVADVACGTAGVSLQLAERTGARVVGVDVTEQMLRVGQRRVRAAGRADRVSLVVGQGERLPLADSSVDALTFTYLLRYVADPAATIRELARAVRPGGVVSSLEFAVPDSPVWRPGWLLYTRALLPAAGYATGGREWYEVGRFLGPSISDHYRRFGVDWHVRAWRRAGIDDVQVRRMSLGGGLVMWGHKAGAGPGDG
jgi:demethylmenaquinone methyltransferase/2-methoxy-6-polyprenyl-1,4-benzoquinol methylase